MKVLVVNTVRFRMNGITSVIMNYYRSMDKSDMNIDFVVINKISSSYRQELEANRSKIYYLPRKKNPLIYMWKLYKIIKSNNYDIIHIHGNSAMLSIETLVTFIAKVPVRIIHSHNTTCTHKRLHKLLYPILKKTYTHGFACGEDAGRWMFRNDSFELIKNGIDLNDFNYNEEIRQKYRDKIGAADKKVIGHIGNFIYQKNHTFLIDVFDELLKINSNYLLLLISDGQLLDEMKEKVSKLGIDENIIFLGKTTEINHYLQAMDIFVLPSHYEGLPVVLIEAQAMGLPCLVSDKVSIESKLTDLVKFIPINDTKLWVDAIINERLVNRELNINVYHQEIEDSGYNVSKNADKVKKLYVEYLKEKI